MALSEGVHEVPAAEYHRDPCEAPSLSASIAQTLVTRSPLHAWFDHPRLNPEFVPSESTSEQEEGTALHALLLERVELIEEVDAPDWRTKAAQEARKAARAVGRIPLLTQRAAELRQAAGEMRLVLGQHELGDFLARPGRAEQTLVWRDESEAGPVWCRGRADWLCDDMPVICDLKTTGGSASPDAWGRGAMMNGAAIQAAHYLRGARILGLPHRRFVFVVLERDAPHGVSVVELAPALLEMGADQLAYARDMWAACLRDGEWPGYPGMVATYEGGNGLHYAHEDWKARVEVTRKRKARPFLNVATDAVRNAEQPFA
jgi:hypothetical protein